jgi:hypothetical protein
LEQKSVANNLILHNLYGRVWDTFLSQKDTRLHGPVDSVTVCSERVSWYCNDERCSLYTPGLFSWHTLPVLLRICQRFYKKWIRFFLRYLYTGFKDHLNHFHVPWTFVNIKFRKKQALQEKSTLSLKAKSSAQRTLKKKERKKHGLSPRANYTDRATAARRRSDCQLLRIEGVTWSAWRIPTAVFSVYRQDQLLFYQVVPQLYSRGWVDPVPDPLLFFLVVPGTNRDLRICSQELWPLDHRGGSEDLNHF